jgi:hypothetical protein
MWEIFKHKKGKDFYRDSLAFYSYHPDEYNDDYVEDYYMDDDEIAYRVAQNIEKNFNHRAIAQDILVHTNLLQMDL